MKEYGEKAREIRFLKLQNPAWGYKKLAHVVGCSPSAVKHALKQQPRYNPDKWIEPESVPFIKATNNQQSESVPLEKVRQHLSRVPWIDDKEVWIKKNMPNKLIESVPLESEHCPHPRNKGNNFEDYKGCRGYWDCNNKWVDLGVS